MEINKTEFNLTVEQSAKALWEEFEKTGSVKTYLRYVQKVENSEELEQSDLPFRT